MEGRRHPRDHPARGDLDVEVAIHEEQAAALGRAGRGLAEAVAAYRHGMASGGLSVAEQDLLLGEVVAGVYRLMLQRECAGARSGNLEAIGRAYDVPAAALRRI